MFDKQLNPENMQVRYELEDGGDAGFSMNYTNLGNVMRGEYSRQPKMVNNTTTSTSAVNNQSERYG